ncbi:signal recognition particle-docking protein FtsY [Flammeovirga pacifica]|uniref:Signal recognition particle receptor FtsY n=1 Tax=Flammeovirga pacifica TaxID=915059 RepID=A0A1S1Z308_FLAPC|nr:signal recognition particle-docking protein FtsY [Flammeovirga pacifica]OHX67543.1 signal recognition particle-docking protein FtsY [Flammeovirga pacifica]
MGFFKKIFGKTEISQEEKENLDKGLEKSRGSIFDKITKAVAGKSKVDDDVLDNLEEILVTSDVGVETTLKIIDRIEARVEKDKYVDAQELNQILHEEIASLLDENKSEDVDGFSIPEGIEGPYVMLVVGVNGVGKTTTIGKLSAKFKAKGYKVVLGAADTFRAAAVDQLKLWGERTGVEVVAKGMNVDPSSVAFEAVKKGVDSNADIIIVDTAGRLHNKVNLMNELSKIKRSMQKVAPGVPHDVILVLDGSTGQNAQNQAREFMKATEVSGLAITKLDGTAKGGVVIGISDEFKIPVKYIGVGEGVDHLQAFRKMEFVESLFGGRDATKTN